MNFRILCSFLLLSSILLIGCEDDPVAVEIKRENLAKDYNNDVVAGWTDLYLDIERYLPGFRPAATARALAYINMAAYETAIPGMPYFVSNALRQDSLIIPDLPTNDIKKYHWNIAINACMARTFEHFLINKTAEHSALIKDLEASYNAQLGPQVSQEVFNNSQLWGRAVADAVIKFAKTDIEAEAQILDPSPESYVPPTGEGKWQPAPGDKALFPYWGKVRTFANHNDQLKTLDPPIYSTAPGSRYYRDFAEVNKAVTLKEGQQYWMAEFWSDDIVGLSFSPPARLFAIANQIIVIEDIDLETTLHMYCKLGIAENDGAVAAWKAKYEYNVERPVHYIRKFINSEFRPLLGEAIGVPGLTPSFPGYPSGHSTFGGLGSTVLSAFIGEDYYFTDRCHEGRDEFNGTPRSYSRIGEFGEEDAYSRIYLGVHPRFDCVEGLRLGKQIANNVLNYELIKD